MSHIKLYLGVNSNLNCANRSHRTVGLPSLVILWPLQNFSRPLAVAQYFKSIKFCFHKNLRPLVCSPPCMLCALLQVRVLWSHKYDGTDTGRHTFLVSSLPHLGNTSIHHSFRTVYDTYTFILLLIKAQFRLYILID